MISNYSNRLDLRYLLILCCIFLPFFLSAQDSLRYDKESFRSPLDIPIYLSGTFGEPRLTHFHTGIDIKTMGVEGKKIYAIEDGYVWRIRTSPFGYGNALYINHPNGYTSVYAHLQSFNDSISTYLRKQQFEQKMFDVDLDSLPVGLIPVKKGELIGLSGNSGGSGGPHLHFEIRDSLERPINPLHFGYDQLVKDEARPEIYNLLVYNLSTDRQFTDAKQFKPTNLGNGLYSISNTISVNRDEIGFGLHTLDRFTGISNKNGVYEILLYQNDELVYHFQLNRISFDHSKHVFSQCDFSRKRKHKQTIYKCFREKGNLLTAHPYLNNDGVIYLTDSTEHKIKIVVKDYHQNSSEINFKVKRNDGSNTFKAEEDPYYDLFSYATRNTFVRENFQLEILKESLFDDLYFHYEEIVDSSALSNRYVLQDVYTPVAKYFTLRIKANKIDSALTDKYLILRKDYKGRTKALAGTRYKKQFFEAESRDFGEHFLGIDTIGPKIEGVNIYKGKQFSGQSTIKFKATDALSGINEYNAFLNGSWVILEYDAKRALFTYRIDEFCKSGENEITVVISDERNNASQSSYNFNYTP